MQQKWLLTAALTLSIIVPTRLVSANVAPATRHPGALQGPHFLEPTELVVEHEQLRFDCGRIADRIGCSFEARYQVHNPTEQVESVVAAFYGINAEDVRIRVDGEEVEHELSQVELAYLDDLVAGEQGDGGTDEPGGTLFWPGQELASDARVGRTGLTLVVAPGQRCELVVTGVARPGATWFPEFPSGLRVRHLLLYRGRDARSYGVDYLLSPIQTWGQAGPIDVEVRYPAGWQFEGGPIAIGDVWEDAWSVVSQISDGDWQITREGEVSVATRTLAPDDGDRLALELTVPGSRVFHGGPLVGVGSVADLDDFGMRFGWEIAAPEWLHYSVNLDADFDDYLVLTPLAEAATPFLGMLPHLGVGAGVPVRVQPDTQVGGRLNFTVGFGVLNYVLTLDFYPGLSDSAEDVWQTSMFGQISL